MSLFDSFQALPAAISAVEFSALPLPGLRGDFLAKAKDGGPVFLLKDSSPASYSPAIELRHVSVQFHNTCRVTTVGGNVEDQFAVIACEAGVAELHEVFVRCLAAAVEQLPAVASTSDLQRCLQSLLNLFRALSRPSSREVTGLWAELFVMAKSKHVVRALQAWRADPFERFDFAWATGCLEVKAAVSVLRQHEFALEQLQSPLDGAGYVASVLLRAMGVGVGVVDLASEIEARIAAYPTLRQKLWENIAVALGNDFSERLDRRFDPSYAERSLAIYAMSDVPAPPQPSDPRVTAVRFRVDMSTVTSSLGQGARSFIDGLFGKTQNVSVD
ncbi:PD-(D/E)XK motif protein [Paracidovorax oryzae]|uniref:PD-(D/E)XK motif protein n=1 Tax=Paracidovorax oryzae TaxID=862720 RepID=UPI00036F155B|nr:PD-(D/E)XK motif protein [Paracidovorax oryzae]